MNIDTARVNHAMIQEIFNRLLKEVIIIDEDPRTACASKNGHVDYTLPSGSIRINRDRVEWYCALIDSLIRQERLMAVRSELNDILDSWDVENFHDRNALKDRLICYSRELQGLFEEQGALERGRRYDD
jgi:hypothetical protein|nr:MAG TPA: hypothetical protein [Caudoviricetes sp.]